MKNSFIFILCAVYFALAPSRATSDDISFRSYHGVYLYDEAESNNSVCKFELGDPVLPSGNPLTIKIVSGWESFMHFLYQANIIAKQEKDTVKEAQERSEIIDITTAHWHLAMTFRARTLDLIYKNLGIAGNNIESMFDDAAKKCVKHLIDKGTFVIDRRFEPPVSGFLGERGPKQ